MPAAADNPREAAARRYDTWFDTGWGARAWPVEMRAVLDAVGPVTRRRVLEVGCGTGRLAAALADQGADVLGVDLDAGMLSVAAGRVPGRLVRADATRLPVATGSVDAAVTLATLEFAHDPAVVLAEMARAVRPGGRIVAAVLNPRSPWGMLDRPGRREPYRSGCFLPAGELARMAAGYGRAARTGALFAVPQLPLPRGVATVLERAGRRLLSRCGALQAVTIDLAP